ncbi:MAG: AAA family ATPase, partial [Rhodoferax sp.]|nr:AAA family ATPase [Rhodoferax sp.]
GEQRCLSIAAFFAELSTADDPSGIVFDDPVSSLDFQWRGSVAQRLVEESKRRQVIVFTHDVVFFEYSGPT